MSALQELRETIQECYVKYHCSPVAVVCPIDRYREILASLSMNARSEEARFTVETPNPEVYGLTIYPSHFAPKMLPLFGSLYGALAHEFDDNKRAALDAAKEEK